MKEFISKILDIDFFEGWVENHYRTLCSLFSIYSESVASFLSSKNLNCVLILSYRCNQSFRQIVGTLCLFGKSSFICALENICWYGLRLRLIRCFLFHFQAISERIYTSSQMPFHTFSASEWQFQSSVLDEHARPALILGSQPHIHAQGQNQRTTTKGTSREMKQPLSLSRLHTSESQLACQHYGKRCREPNRPFSNMGGNVFCQDAFKSSV